MFRLIVPVALATLAMPALADYDAAAEAREAAARKAAQQEQARRQADAERLRTQANNKAMRAYLGREAEGKSDAEVKKLYEARTAGLGSQAKQARQAAGSAGADLARQEAQTRPTRDAGMRQMTGKSLNELEGMSDRELEAFAREMEKKYGAAK